MPKDVTADAFSAWEREPSFYQNSVAHRFIRLSRGQPIRGDSGQEAGTRICLDALPCNRFVSEPVDRALSASLRHCTDHAPIDTAVISSFVGSYSSLLRQSESAMEAI